MCMELLIKLLNLLLTWCKSKQINLVSNLCTLHSITKSDYVSSLHYHI